MKDHNFIGIEPVLPSSNIERDVDWYVKNVGFQLVFSDEMYAVLRRENICVHLQWHTDTNDDPLMGGSVIKIFVKNINTIFDEFVESGFLKKNKLRLKTPWNTNEFGFYDLNNNAIFFVEDIR